MAVHLRLARTGRHKRPMYRVIAADSRKPRDGRFLEILGIFDPLKNPAVPVLKAWRPAHCDRSDSAEAAWGLERVRDREVRKGGEDRKDREERKEQEVAGITWRRSIKQSW